RFRLGTDASVSREGWYIDDIKVIIGGSCGVPTSSPTSTITPTVTSSPTVTSTPTPPCVLNPASTDVPKSIPDFSGGSPGVVSSTLSVGGIGAISDLDMVGLAISHTWIGDMQVSL